jgi:chromosome segregation ATPase
LQNFFILRAMRTVTPGRIPDVTMKELSAVLAECAARTEIARAGVEEARKGIEAATKKQEAIRAEVEKLRPMWEKERVEFRERFEESRRKTDLIVAELREGRDERRALLEAMFRVMDQQQPPPPNLRSV